MRWYLLLLLLVLTGCGVSEPMEDASILPVQAVPESEPAPMPEPEAADFVRVQEYLPDILVDLKYAGRKILLDRLSMTLRMPISAMARYKSSPLHWTFSWARAIPC